MQEYHGKSWLVLTLPTSNGESRVARRNGEMISPRFLCLGISTVFSEGKFSRCLAAACPLWGPQENTGDKARGGVFRRHKDLTELGVAEN